MGTRRTRWAAAILAALALAGPVCGEEVVWKAVARSPSAPAVVASANVPAQAAPSTPAAVIGRPLAIATASDRSAVVQSTPTVLPVRPDAPPVVGRSGPF